MIHVFGVEQISTPFSTCFLIPIPARMASSADTEPQTTPTDRRHSLKGKRMKTQKPRILIRENDRDLAFCHLKFRKALSSYVNKQRSSGHVLTQTELIQNIADRLHLSLDSINNYKKGHNGPAGIDVVKEMAAYLELDWTELMKEVSPMAEKKMVEMEKKIENTSEKQETPANSSAYHLTEFEKQSAWSAVREVYKALLVYVSFFEGDSSVELDPEDSLSDPIIRSYDYCWTILHKHMLDIPDHTYDKLVELIEEMRFWIYGLPAVDIDHYDPQDDSFELHYFGRLRYLELNEEMGVDYDECKEQVTKWVVEDFYRFIRSILKNYIPREPAAGDGCPQSSPRRE